MPAQVVAHTLAWLMAATALLLAALLWRSRGALVPAARAWAHRLAQPLRRAALAGSVLCGLVAVADVYLPPDVTPTRIQGQRPLENGALDVSFGTCCTGGGMATCEVPPAPWVRDGQPIQVRRSSLLGRCTVEPRPVEGACRCG